MWQAACARPSACRASGHGAGMQVSAVRQWEHACCSTSAALALGVAAQPGVHPRGTVSVPRWRSTSAAISQQPVGRFPPKFKTTQLVTRARWPWRSARATRGHADLHRSRKKLHDFSMPPPYSFTYSCTVGAPVMVMLMARLMRPELRSRPTVARSTTYSCACV